VKPASWWPAALEPRVLALVSALGLAGCGAGGASAPGLTPSTPAQGTSGSGSPIKLNPPTLNFGALGSEYAESFSASEQDYTGSFSVLSAQSTCLTPSAGSGQASVSPLTGTEFTVTALGVGGCTIVVADANNVTATLSVTITTTVVGGH
jgi:hypothetical protein